MPFQSHYLCQSRAEFISRSGAKMNRELREDSQRPSSEASRSPRFRLSHFACVGIMADGARATVVAARTIPGTTAFDKIPERSVVLKSVPQYNISQRGRQKLIREIEIHMRLGDHPNITTMHGSFEDSRGIYLVLERLHGPTLHDFLCEHRRLDEIFALSIIEQLVEPISFMHSRGYSHRDISSKNIMFRESPSLQNGSFHVMLIDLGHACYSDPDNEDKNRRRTEKIGTLRFTAPEVYRDADYQPEACDVWSIGVLMYYMLMGIYPYTGRTEEEVLQRITDTKLRLRGGDWDLISDETKDIIKRLLQPMPPLRSDVETLKSDIRKALRR